MTQFCYFKMLREFREFQSCLHNLLDQKYVKTAKVQDNRKKRDSNKSASTTQRHSKEPVAARGQKIWFLAFTNLTIEENPKY